MPAAYKALIPVPVTFPALPVPEVKGSPMLLSEPQMREKLARHCDARGLESVAAEIGVQAEHLVDVLAARCRPNALTLKAFGLRELTGRATDLHQPVA